MRYLGLPLIIKRLAHSDCLSLLGKFNAKVGGWRRKFLSYMGRLMLLKSVLGSIYIYLLALFLMPIRTVYEINRVCQNILLNGPDSLTSRALIGWEDNTYSSAEGGLGGRDLVTVNRACIMRHMWNIVSGKEILRV